MLGGSAREVPRPRSKHGNKGGPALRGNGEKNRLPEKLDRPVPPCGAWGPPYRPAPRRSTPNPGTPDMLRIALLPPQVADARRHSLKALTALGHDESRAGRAG